MGTFKLLYHRILVVQKNTRAFKNLKCSMDELFLIYYFHINIINHFPFVHNFYQFFIINLPIKKFHKILLYSRFNYEVAYKFQKIFHRL